MSAQYKTVNKDLKKSNTNIDSTVEAVSSLTPQLVIALCGPIGSPLKSTAIEIDNKLKDFGYQTSIIKLSDIIKINSEKVGKAVEKSNKFEEINSLIEIGDTLRKYFGNDILSKFAIAKIAGDRSIKFGQTEDVASEKTKDKSNKILSHRICHVIDSIKNSAELDLLRLVYGDSLFAIGVFSPIEVRVENLEKSGELKRDEIRLLIDTDSGEEFSHGQSVRETFPKSDFFLRVDAPIIGATEAFALSQIGQSIHRFLNLIFKTSIITPTTDEMAMYAATSASRNSACLSRQVGAAVTSNNGELLAVGWNDAPQSGGGLYGRPTLSRTININSDQRCFNKTGRLCHNETEKKSIAEKIADSFIRNKIFGVELKDKAIESILADSRIKDLIEFSRAVHAEMHAVLNASRLAGEKIIDGKIYVTTYPCHSCARHLVAAGISEIQYIEPYRKSLATRLHDDALTEETKNENRVKLRQYDGVAPRRYIEIFEGGNRKSKGVLFLPTRTEAPPFSQVSLKAIPRLEEAVVVELTDKCLYFPSLQSKEEPKHGQASNK